MTRSRIPVWFLLAMLVLAGCATTDEQVVVSFTPLNVAPSTEPLADGLTPLHVAVRDGNAVAVRQLLQQGAIVDATSTMHSRTPLMLAAARGAEDLVSILLEAGAQVDAVDSLHSTALLTASSKGYAGVVNILLQHGAAVNFHSPRDQLDSTALTLAAGNGHDAVLTLLLKAGAEIDWRTARDGSSALMLAAAFGHAGTVRQLLTAGANPALRDHRGNTACTAAAVHGHGAVIQVLNDFALSRKQGMPCRLKTGKRSQPATRAPV